MLIKIGILLVLLLNLAFNLNAQVSISGKVSDDNDSPIISARIRMGPLNPPNPALVKETESDNGGEFTFMFDSPPGDYFMDIKSDGFNEIEEKNIRLEAGPNSISIQMLSVAKFSVDVSPDTEKNIIILEQAELTRTIDGEDLIDIPITRTDDILKALSGGTPGAIEDSAGNVHFDGDPGSQNWLLGSSFIITDPVSYTLETKIMNFRGIDSIDSLSRYSVDKGKGFATSIIYPQIGGDKLVVGADNPIPGFDFVKGLTLTNWRPRISISGPIKKQQAWFSNSFIINYDKRIIEELPEGKDRTSMWLGNNLSTVQANISHRNILNANLMIYRSYFPNSALSPFHPAETTTDDTEEVQTFNIKESIFIGENSILEFGYGRYGSKFRQEPDGIGTLKINPFGQSGFAYIDSFRSGTRDQYLANFSFPANGLLPEIIGEGHRFKTGIDVHRIGYCQDIKRTALEVYRFDGNLSHSNTFGGNGAFCRSNTETAVYFQDSWNVKPWLFLQMGIRADKDRIVSKTNVTSRHSVTIMPSWLKNTKLSMGFGFMPAPYPLPLFTRHLDQYSIIQDFETDGKTSKKPFVTAFSADYSRLVIPRSTNFSVGIEHKLPGNFFLGLNYLRKRSKDMPTFIASARRTPPDGLGQELPEVGWGVFYELKNAQKVIYDSLEIAVKKSGQIKSRHFRWLASYMKSRGLSNAALDPFIDNPIIFSDIAGPMPWDVPKRLLSFGYFELSDKNAISYHLQWRSGFPYTAHDDQNGQIGEFNSHRMPDYFSINLYFERKLKLFGRKWRLQVGCDNCANNKNYNLVNGNVTAWELLNNGKPIYLGSQPRKPAVFKIMTDMGR